MRKAAVLLLALLILVSGVAVGAAGGSASDPLVSLSYLNTTWAADALKQATTKVDAGTQTTYQSVLTGLEGRHATYLARAGATTGGSAATTGDSGFRDGRYKRGDVITLPTGSGVLLLAGSAAVGHTAGGAVVDVTAGSTTVSGGVMTARHRYLAGENTSAVVTITSDTAVLSVEGHSTLSASGAVDYNRLADALHSAGMFQGTGTGYGSGYDLEIAPTRVVGLVMFLRMLGEEKAALAYTGNNPFVDTPEWCRRYVAYAYSKGYTKGVGTDATGRAVFGTNNALSAGEYMTFVLRALGYTDSGANPDFSWNTSIIQGGVLGVLNAAEQKLLTTAPFLRAQVAYLSCFALSAPMKGGGGILMDDLLERGSLELSASTTLSGVSNQRLS